MAVAVDRKPFSQPVRFSCFHRNCQCPIVVPYANDVLFLNGCRLEDSADDCGDHYWVVCPRCRRNADLPQSLISYVKQYQHWITRR